MSTVVKHKFISLKPEQADPTIIGPNEWNDTHDVINTDSVIVACDYNFTPQSPGGNLVVGANSIILNPMPKGLAIGGSLYISGGVGAAEAVTIVGLSGTNTVIVNCGNIHSGGWTIGSATGGLQEAIAGLPAAGGKIIVSCNITLYANVVALGKQVLVEKYPGYTIAGMNPYTILGSIDYNPVSDCIYTTEEIIIGPHSNGTKITTYPLDTGVKMIRTVGPFNNQGYSHSTLFVQNDFNGIAGTPAGILSRLNCNNNSASNGVAAVLGYTNLGANSSTIGMGVHGDCTISNPGAAAIALNAEGNYLGSAPGGQMFGLVSNLNDGPTQSTKVTGAYIIMNSNPGGALNTEGGVRIVASAGSLHNYGLMVYDQGGTFKQTAIFYSEQTDANNINILNGSPAAVGTLNINFRRTNDTHSEPNVNLIANIRVTHPPSNYSAGSIQLRTSNDGATTKAGLTVDPAQFVTVANCIRTTPVKVADLVSFGAVIGSWACVNDSTTNTLGAVVTGGGGTFTVGIFYSTRGWVVVAN